jgi:hypothetical protein
MGIRRKKMNEAKIMDLEEVEQCDYAYILYEKEDPEVHCFLRMQTFNDFISFDRPLPRGKDGKIFGDVHSQPHLWKEYYGKSWWAFTVKPTSQQIAIKKRKMKDD